MRTRLPGFLVLAGALLAPAGARAQSTTPEPAPAGPDEHPQLDEARPSWRPGALVDGDAGRAAGAFQLGVRDRVSERLARHELAVLDIESGDIQWRHFFELGLDLAGHWTWASAAVHGAYRRDAGGDTFIEQAQLEANLTAAASLIAMAEWEQPRGRADTYRGALVLRLFPVERFLVELGGGYGHVGDGSTAGGFEPYLTLEWQLPLPGRTWQASLFAERDLEDLELAGVRFAWDMGATIRELARKTGWRRVR